MKKILKSILLFVIIFIGTLSVKAVPTINYELGKYIGVKESEILDELSIEGGYIILSQYYADGKYIVSEILDKEFNSISYKEIKSEYYYYDYAVLSDVILMRYTNYIDGASIDYIDIYNHKLELIKTIEVSQQYFEHYSSLKGENDKYYIIGNEIIDKKTKEYVELEELIMQSDYKEEIEKALENNDFETIKEYCQKIYEKEFSGTFIPLLAKVETSKEWPEFYEILETSYNNNKIAFTYYNDIDNVFGTMIFDEEGKLIFDEITSDTTLPKIMLDKNEFYIVEYIVEEISNKETTLPEVVGHFQITGYDYTGEKVLSKKLSMSSSHHHFSDNIFYYGRQLDFATLTMDGFYLITNYHVIEQGFDPTLDEDDIIVEEKYSTIQKYNFINSIETKTDGNGKIEVKESSKPGEAVTFVVTPNDGYKIDIIKVTDAEGNILTFKENTFTMPNSNVVVEVSFTKEVKNSETADIAIFSCIAIIILGGIGTIYSIRKLSWLK